MKVSPKSKRKLERRKSLSGEKPLAISREKRKNVWKRLSNRRKSGGTE